MPARPLALGYKDHMLVGMDSWTQGFAGAPPQGHERTTGE
jgi:hypothetical protein